MKLTRERLRQIIKEELEEIRIHPKSTYRQNVSVPQTRDGKILGKQLLDIGLDMSSKKDEFASSVIALSNSLFTSDKKYFLEARNPTTLETVLAKLTIDNAMKEKIKQECERIGIKSQPEKSEPSYRKEPFDPERKKEINVGLDGNDL